MTSSENLVSRLSSMKTSIEEKLDIFHQLDKRFDPISTGKEQWMINCLISCLENISNSDRNILEHSKHINKLLIMLNTRLKLLDHNRTDYFLNSNIYEILAKYHKHECICAEHLYQAWHHILQVKDWEKQILLKPNTVTVILRSVCQHFARFEKNKIHENVDIDMLLELFNNLLLLFKRQAKLHCNTKKAFQSFCQKLLCALLNARWKLKDANLETCSSNGEMKKSSGDIISNIDALLTTVICQKEHILSLKVCLSPPKTEEPAAKRSKNSQLFQQLFDVLRDGLKDDKRLTFSVDVLYKIIMSGSRSLPRDGGLTRYEELPLLLRLCRTLDLVVTDHEDVIATYVSCFEVLKQYDAYQSVWDSTNAFRDWMFELVKSLIRLFSECNMSGVKTQTLVLLGMIVNINHNVMEANLSELLAICLNGDVETDDVRKAQQQLLCEILETYSRLHHKLGHLMQNIAMNIKPNSRIPYTFINKYSKMIPSLQMSQILTFLKLFDQMANELTEELNESNVTVLQHVSYLLCYLVLVNAALIPENFYMRKELQDVIDTMTSLKDKTMNIQTSLVKRNQNDNISVKLSSVVLLLQHGINEVMLFLQHFALTSSEKGEDKKMHLFTRFNNINLKPVTSDQPILVYLQVFIALDELKYGFVEESHEAKEDEEKTYKSHLLDICNAIISNHEKIVRYNKQWDGQVFHVDSENVWLALCTLIMDNVELFYHLEAPDIHEVIAEIFWIWNLKCCPGNEDVNSVAMSVYNKKNFQSSFINQIVKSLNFVLKNHWSHSPTLDIEKDSKLATKVKPEHITKFKEVFEGILRLDMLYMSEDTVQTLYSVFLNVFMITKGNRNFLEFNQFSVTRFLQKLVESSLDAGHTKDLPCAMLFESVLEFYIHSHKNEMFDASVLSVFSPLTQLICHHAKQDEDTIQTVNNKLLTVISSDKRMALDIIMTCLHGIQEVLNIELTVTKGVSNTIALFIRSMLSTVGKELSCDVTFDKYENETIKICARICGILENLTRLRKLTSKQETLQEHLVQLLQRIFPVLQQRVNKGSEQDLEYLGIASYVMVHTELSDKLKEPMQYDELSILSHVISSLKDNLESKDEYVKLLKKVVTESSEGKLPGILQLLSDELDDVFSSGPSSSYILEVWEQVIKCKWTKDKKPVLLKFLPKVIMGSIHLISMGTMREDTLRLLRILSSCIPIARYSFVSSYFGMVYHIYNTECLLPMLQYSQYERFGEIFEELYRILSLFLFHHEKDAIHAFHSFVSCVNNLFNALVINLKKNTDEISEDQIERSYNRMSRLYFELGSHKENISKFSAYIIAGYIRVFSSAYIDAKYKTIMDTGICEVFKTCTEYELAMMSTAFESAEREHFRMLRSHFEKHHKYAGKT